MEVSDPLIGLDGSEWEACDIHCLQGSSCKERALADIRLTNKPNDTSQLNQLNNGAWGLNLLS
jgi:hypothetical protein